MIIYCSDSVSDYLTLNKFSFNLCDYYLLNYCLTDIILNINCSEEKFSVLYLYYFS